MYQLKEVKIEVTHRCPLACVHCSSDAVPDSDRQMDENTCLELIQETMTMGVKEVVFSGGEPLWWPGLAKVVTVAHESGVAVGLYTSGVVDDVAKRLATLKDAGLSKVVFSIFGATAETHERITRKKGSFHQTLRAINAANGLGFEPEFHFVPFRGTYQELIAIDRLAKKLGVTRLSVLRFVPQGRGYLFRTQALDRVDNVRLREIIVGLRKKGSIIRTGSPYNFLFLNENPSCLSATDRLIIGPDLRIYPCDAFKQIKAEEVVRTSDYSTLDGFSLEECWLKSPFLDAVRRYLTSGFPEECESCNLFDRCRSGCLAQKVIATGDFRKQVDPMCIREMGAV